MAKRDSSTYSPGFRTTNPLLASQSNVGVWMRPPMCWTRHSPRRPTRSTLRWVRRPALSPVPATTLLTLPRFCPPFPDTAVLVVRAVRVLYSSQGLRSLLTPSVRSSLSWISCGSKSHLEMTRLMGCQSGQRSSIGYGVQSTKTKRDGKRITHHYCVAAMPEQLPDSSAARQIRRSHLFWSWPTPSLGPALDSAAIPRP